MLCANHQAVVPGEHDGQGVSAFQPGERRLRGRHGGQAAGKMQVQQHGDRFRVGLGLEHLSGRLQLVTEGGVVLDDAVMHDGDARRAVRMGVGLGGGAMGRPSRVANSSRAEHGRAVEHG